MKNWFQLLIIQNCFYDSKIISFIIVWTSSKQLYLKPTHQKWCFWMKKWILHWETTFELKMYIFSYKIFHLWSKIRNFQYCLDFLTTTLLQANKPTMVMLGEEMQLMHCNYGSKICCFDPIHQCKPDPNILSHNLTLKLAILEVFLSNKTWNSWLFTLKVTSLGLISNIGMMSCKFQPSSSKNLKCRQN